MPFVKGFVILAGTVLAARISTILALKLGRSSWVMRCMDLVLGAVWGIVATVWVLELPPTYSAVPVIGFLLGRETQRWLDSRETEQRAGRQRS